MANWIQCFVTDPVKLDTGAEQLSFCLQVLPASKISAGNITTITFWRALFVTTSETLLVSHCIYCIYLKWRRIKYFICISMVYLCSALSPTSLMRQFVHLKSYCIASGPKTRILDWCGSLGAVRVLLLAHSLTFSRRS
ncbi:hypothetical protein ANCCAN_12002 [Ancylostoma caninum]|uniref:Uncharacterized protein n=1 Tax=Ancylostoma caninum TaxID=29170 RepID=A0A368GGQ8_ANCCA|nr:hypothetical protein ANCCAN_12002 [Ancylostoma caninum]